jgi:diacylglycerol kinase
MQWVLISLIVASLIVCLINVSLGKAVDQITDMEKLDRGE